MLAKNLDFLDVTWPFIIIIAGIVLMVRAIPDRKPGPIFFSTLIMLIGVMFLAREQGWIAWYTPQWPMILLAAGVSFLVSYWLTKTDSHLATGIILVVLGTTFLIADSSGFRGRRLERFMRDVLEWWPLLLLGAGVYLLTNQRK